MIGTGRIRGAGIQHEICHEPFTEAALCHKSFSRVQQAVYSTFLVRRLNYCTIAVPGRLNGHSCRISILTGRGSQMQDSEEILSQARQRARKMGLPYEGVVLPGEAYELLQQLPDAKLVDVRTRAELHFVGRVPGSVDIEWNSYPTMQRNANFIQQLIEAVPQDAPVLFVCRSGGRSHEAALVAAQAGYAKAYNVLEGFEGERDADGHRGTLGGWRHAGLPWVQT